MTTSISSVLVDCLKSFNNLTTQPELADYAIEVPSNLWADELGRLRVWAANIGAHQTGQSSLDYRLRDASHIKTQTVKLLERLQRTLDDVDEFLAEDAEEDQALSVDDGEEPELLQIYKSVVDTIDCLFRLSMIIRRPAQHDKLLGTKKLDATVFEPFDVSSPSLKFCKRHYMFLLTQNVFPRVDTLILPLSSLFQNKPCFNAFAETTCFQQAP
jgi:hypothetical protein